MEQALLLNASYEPLKVVHWQKAITLWCQGKVEVIAVHDREIRAVSFSFKLPSVIRLLRFVRIKRRFDYVPVLAGEHLRARPPHVPVLPRQFPTSELTFDHVVPVAHGGRKDWENIVTCCVGCNRQKGGRTPAEAGMRLLRPPRRPDSAPAIRITMGWTRRPRAGATISTGTWNSTKAERRCNVASLRTGSPSHAFPRSLRSAPSKADGSPFAATASR